MARASDDRQLICKDFNSELERMRREARASEIETAGRAG